VVHHIDADQLARLSQSPRERHVGGARSRIAARVIVRLMCPESLCGGAQALAAEGEAKDRMAAMNDLSMNFGAGDPT
jgi:hypothetical protein